MKKIKIKEVIIVEGRDDVTAVKRVVDGHVIPLNGYSGLTKQSLSKLEKISKTSDLILFTDPDYAGKKIRDLIRKHIPNIKHAFISRKNAEKKGNIGVENASDTAILSALENIISEGDNNTDNTVPTFTKEDLILNGLMSGEGSKEKRVKLGDYLKIGYYNAKQLLNALNSFNISREAFDEAIRKIDDK